MLIKEERGEQWKVVKFDLEYTNDFRLEVSNLGRLRTFNKISNGNIINGSMINGYRIIRLKLFRPRDPKTQTRLDHLKKELFKAGRKIKSLKENNETQAIINETTDSLESLKKSLSRKFRSDLKVRTMHYHALIHRLVAEYFLSKPGAAQIIVAHLDYNKLNNRVNNLRWMTPEENYAHQKISPYVIREKEERRYRRKENSKATKLTVTKVMLLKKLLRQDKPMKQLVKQFKVTDTQILRIKRGENWADIPAAN